jgi:zinc protease
VKRVPNLPLVNVQVYAMSGSLADTPETAGRAALVGSMLDQGTDAHSAEQIAEYFDSIGGKLATTAGRNTVYASMTVLRDDFPKAAALFAECVNRPAFAKEPFERMKALVLGAIAQRSDDPQHEALELFFDNLPAASPYHLLEEGKKETVEALKAEDLRAFHARYFVPNNMIITVFGDIEPDAAMAVVRENFGGLKPAADFKPVTFQRDNALAQSIVKHKQTGKDTGMIVLGYPAMSIFDKQDFAALTMLQAVMAGYRYPGGWLHNELRGAGLVYYVHAMPMTGPAPGYFVILSQTQPDKIDEVVGRIEKNVARAKAGEITPEEFDVARQRVLAMHAQENTTIASQAQQAAPNALYGLGFDYDKTFDARIQAVTLPDLSRVARKYLNNHVLVTTSPRPAAKPAGQPAAGGAAR